MTKALSLFAAEQLAHEAGDHHQPDDQEFFRGQQKNADLGKQPCLGRQTATHQCRQTVGRQFVGGGSITTVDGL